MKVLWTAAGQYIIHPCCVDKRKVGVYDTTGQSTFEKSRNICLDKEQKIGSAVDVDEDEFVVVGEHTNASAEKEGVGPKSLDEDVVRVPEFIDKDVETCTANTATSDAPVGGDGPSKTNKSPQNVEVS
ncbi:hypothetical protein V6N13_001222 [Hibiscus sabdariffa]